jgi:hypothetical protein
VATRSPEDEAVAGLEAIDEIVQACATVDHDGLPERCTGIDDHARGPANR